MQSRELARTIEQKLRRHEGKCVCDECLAQELGGEDIKRVARVTAHLSTGANPEISRYRAKCETCGVATMVARASPSFSWA